MFSGKKIIALHAYRKSRHSARSLTLPCISKKDQAYYLRLIRVLRVGRQEYARVKQDGLDELLGLFPGAFTKDNSMFSLSVIMKKALATLSRRERAILRYYYREGYTLQQIGEHLHISKQRVCVVRDIALRKLRSPRTELRDHKSMIG